MFVSIHVFVFVLLHALSQQPMEVGRCPKVMYVYLYVGIVVSAFVVSVFVFVFLLLHALSQQRVDVGRCPKVMVSFSETSGQDHMFLIVIVFVSVFRVTIYFRDICRGPHVPHWHCICIFFVFLLSIHLRGAASYFVFFNLELPHWIFTKALFIRSV